MRLCQFLLLSCYISLYFWIVLTDLYRESLWCLMCLTLVPVLCTQSLSGITSCGSVVHAFQQYMWGMSTKTSLRIFAYEDITTVKKKSPPAFTQELNWCMSWYIPSSKNLIWLLPKSLYLSLLYTTVKHSYAAFEGFLSWQENVKILWAVCRMFEQFPLQGMEFGSELYGPCGYSYFCAALVATAIREFTVMLFLDLGLQVLKCSPLSSHWFCYYHGLNFRSRGSLI